MGSRPHARLGLRTRDCKKVRNVDQIVSWTFGIAKNLEAILKDRVEESLSKDLGNSRSSKDRLLEIIEEELRVMSEDIELLQALLKSYPARLDAVRNAGGYHTEY